MNNKQGNVLLIVLGIVALVLIAGGVYYFSTQNKSDEVANQVVTQVVDKAVEEMENNVNDMMEVEYQYSANLEDVSGGTAIGVAYANYDEGGYVAYATFNNLPELDEGYFYEGWVVRKSPQNVISSGVVKMENGVYVNRFSASDDLTDHSFYVLTLEPDDGDPAPAEHILEGTLTEN
jgi:hypothetical protein